MHQLYSLITGKIGYHESFATDMEIERTEKEETGGFRPLISFDSSSGDHAFDIMSALPIGSGTGVEKFVAYNNWFPYYTLMDCEAACRADPRCKTATYIQEDTTDMRQDSWIPSLKLPELVGKCLLNSGTPNVVPNTDNAKLQYTIRKEDKGELNCHGQGDSSIYDSVRNNSRII